MVVLYVVALSSNKLGNITLPSHITELGGYDKGGLRRSSHWW